MMNFNPTQNLNSIFVCRLLNLGANVSFLMTGFLTLVFSKRVCLRSGLLSRRRLEVLLRSAAWHALFFACVLCRVVPTHAGMNGTTTLEESVGEVAGSGLAMGQVAQQDQATPDPIASPGRAVRLQVPLPINEANEKWLKAGIDQALNRWSESPAADRPTLLLEFDTAANLTGAGSEFERCLAIANHLRRPELARKIKTVAYVPPASGFASATGLELNLQLKSQLAGHALLVALACEELWLDEEASLGSVGADAANSELEILNYQAIAKRGLQWSPPVVAALVEKTQGLYRVTKSDGKAVFADQSMREALAVAGDEVASEELLAPGADVNWTAGQLSTWGLIPPPVVNRNDLLSRLETEQLVDLVPGENLQDTIATLLDVTQLDREFVDWSTRSLIQEVSNEQANLLFVKIDTLGGYDLRAAAELATVLADLNPKQVRTVALLPNGADGAETLVAMACDEIVLGQGTSFGGMVTLALDDDNQVSNLIETARLIGERKNRDWSLIAGLALGNQEIHEYRNRKSGAQRLLNQQQYADLPDSENWQKQGEVKLANGLPAAEAKRRKIVDHVTETTESAKMIYGVDDWKVLVPNFTDRGIQRFANFLNRPGIAGLLLMIGMFALMIELSSPGLGVPGFVSACCLGLFFWSHYLEGSAGALEVLLFVLGIIFVLIELFVIPGFGLFGISGGVMLFAAIVLACQDFVLPSNSAEVNRMVWSMMTLLAGMAGVFAAILFIRYYMEKVPFLNRLILAPPSGAGDGVMLDSPPETSKFAPLLDRIGEAVTPLMPSGKVKIGNQLVNVITDGRVVEKGSTVRVYEVIGSLVKVEPVS